MLDQIQPGVWFSSKRYMLFVLILASPLSRPVLAFPLHREDVGRGRVMLGPSLEEIADPESVLTYNEIKTAGFHPVSSLFVHHGFTSSAWWYRFNYQAKDLQPGDRLMLSLFNVRLHHVSIWIEEPGKAVRRIDGGHRKPQASYYRDTVFRLPISDQTVTVYLRIFTYGPLRIMPALILDEKLHEEDFVREWIYGVFTGSQLVLAVLNLLIFFLLRDKNYLRFSLFAFSTTLTQLSINGYFSLHFALPWDIDLRLILVFGFPALYP